MRRHLEANERKVSIKRGVSEIKRNREEERMKIFSFSAPKPIAVSKDDG